VIRAQFVLSAASASDFPRTGFPEIALVGRSNVGKSSLINALVRETVARTSAAPGKTRLANFYLVDLRSPRGAYYLVDLPGYGYARGGQEAARAFETLAGEYFDRQNRSPRRIAGVLQLVDARHPGLPQDEAAYQWVLKTQLPIAIVATKMDKLARAERTPTLRQLAKTYHSPILPESVPDRDGIDEIGKLIRRWLV
jgi:GTP-binding protein